MRPTILLSAALHVGAVLVLTPIVSDAMRREAAPMMILPVELLEISDSTNVAPISERAKEDEVAKEAEQKEAPQPAAAAPAPAPAEEILPAETPAVKKEPEAKKPEPKKVEPKPVEEDFQSALKGILSKVEKPKEKRDDAADRATNLSEVKDAGPRRGVGDKRRMTMTVADAIRSQLLSKGCWTNQADMADARRLRTVIAVRFGRDGHFLAEPRLVEPAREPSNDPPLQVYIQRARNALSKCNQMGFQIPEQYFEFQPVETIEIELLPGQ